MTNYKVGDLDQTPKNGDCDAIDGNGFWCMRELGHAGQHAAGDGDTLKAVWGDPEPEANEGVWAVVYRDYYDHIEKVYPTELEALRATNGLTGTVKFLPWGKALNEIGEG